ncbi:hypothetical protein SEA_NEFERTHENA_30 [Microbacterium phage Neferthena]|uniref:Uncharacterized protein n=1 Tax=Microbacterium phage Neferthena TaxID=2301539 RepID=A0A385D4H1_9CAUD|nr:hypothetical protein HOT92_gp30 [Microbacterium phage Neferthena]AXQ52894.1 hypothetical protein SEA_NEFERTHENA_30 [Microbacterium phage Neferthena]
MYTRKIRSTGETLTVARATELNADATDGPWVTFCEDHKTIVNSKTEKLAYYTHGEDFCDGCRERIKVNPTNAKVNLNNHKEARAYQEGMRDGLALLVTMLEEGGINNLLEGLVGNARPQDAARVNAYYAAQATPTIVDAGAVNDGVVEPEAGKEYTYTNEKSAKDQRRRLINKGKDVTLIAFDPAREVYAFNLVNA